MKHIIKLTIILITFTLVSCGEKAVQNKQSSQPEQPTFVARQPGTPLNPFALNRLAKQTVVEIVSESYLTGGNKYIPEGSGVIIGRKDSTYYVLTANHISDIDDGLFVATRSEKPGERGEESPLKFIKRYPKEDLAVVKFASVNDYVVAEVGDASRLNNNSEVYVAGWPGSENREGFQFTPAKVSNPRAGNNLTYQPTVPGEDVHKGMSGGAVLNEAGQLVGIHVGLTRVGGDGEGVLISTFLRMVSSEVEEVLVRGTPVVLPSPTRKNQTVTNTKKITPTNKITPSQTQDAESYFKQGNVYLNQEEYEQAIVEYNQAIQLNPKFADAYYKRGLVYSKQEEYEQALADYNQAILLNPNLAEAYKDRGNVYYYQEEYEQALANYNQAIQLNPKFADAYYNRGLVYEKQGKYEQAIAEFNQVILLNPKYADAYRNRGFVYYKQREYEKAIADYNQAILLNPKDAIAYNNRGIVYYDQKEYEQALADYNQAILLNPTFPHPYYNRGLIHKDNQDEQQAIKDLEKAADLYKQQGNQQLYQKALNKLKEPRRYRVY